MRIGIDLGTTFCCVAYIDDFGNAQIIPADQGYETIPSVIWFDGTNAYVGRSADLRKEIAPLFIHELVKLNMGKPTEVSRVLYSGSSPPDTMAYEINGYKYGAAGMSAIILRKLKKEAINYFRRQGKLDNQFDEKQIELEAIITVPAYFGDKQRNDTKLAGFAAGLNVVHVINEPTAAALTYGLSQNRDMKVMVFDLGGGTLDVTILKMSEGNAEVIATLGARSLGGTNWDGLIQNYISDEFRKKNKRVLGPDKYFNVQRKALQAKLDLTDRERTIVSIETEEGRLDTTLYRSAPKNENSEYEMNQERPFYFDERSKGLLTLCENICNNVLHDARLTWGDLDEVLLAGGACRMPMIPEMLERISAKKIRRKVDKFEYDTAIAIGAALYGERKGSVRDVLSQTVGIKVQEGDRFYIDHLLKRNTPLPTEVEKVFPAGAQAILEVYEGDGQVPDLCTLRGHLDLHNPPGEVTIMVHAENDGVLNVTANHKNGSEKLVIRDDTITRDDKARELRAKIQSIVINM